MYLFGHVGLTAGAAVAVDRKVDVRLVMLLAILPDLLDKPLSLLPITHGNTRSFAHGVLGASAVLAYLLARRRPREAALLWGCYAGHLALDRMWFDRNMTILLWPLLGGFPLRDPEAPATPHLHLYNLLGEAAGLAVLGVLAHRSGLLGRTIKMFRRGNTPRVGERLESVSDDQQHPL